MTRYALDIESDEISRGSKEECIARVQQMQHWQPDLEKCAIMVQRDWAPLWFAHLVRQTFLEFLAYEEYTVR